MKIFIGADHRGFQLKAQVMRYVESLGHQAVDMGTHIEGVDCDYPPISRAVGLEVVKHPGSRGILLCMSGIGHSIAANKVPGVLAALVYNKEAAMLSRQHNDSNILVLGAKFTDQPTIMEIVKTWLSTDFEGGRHLRRKQQIQAFEKEFSK